MEQNFKIGDRVKEKASGDDGIVMYVDGNRVKVGWDDGSWFDEESATWWPMDDFELIETQKKREWPKIIATSRFYSECDKDIGFYFEFTDEGLSDINEDLWVRLDEIPAFVEWLQTEYKRLKGE